MSDANFLSTPSSSTQDSPAGVKEIEQRVLSAAFDLLAQYLEECDVEYAFAAQAEVVLSNE